MLCSLYCWMILPHPAFVAQAYLTVCLHIGIRNISLLETT